MYILTILYSDFVCQKEGCPCVLVSCIDLLLLVYPLFPAGDTNPVRPPTPNHQGGVQYQFTQRETNSVSTENFWFPTSKTQKIFVLGLGRPRNQGLVAAQLMGVRTNHWGTVNIEDVVAQVPEGR